MRSSKSSALAARSRRWYSPKTSAMIRASSSSASDASAAACCGLDQLVLQVGDAVGQQPRRVPLGVQPHVLADHQQQPARVVGVVDREVGVQPRQQRRLVAQDPHAGGVERRHPHRPGPRADQLHHPLAHLGGGLVGEGDGQHLADADVAGGQQVGDAAGEHGRLARSRAGDDEQRRALVQHRLTLLRVEAVEKLVGLGGDRSRAHHVCPNLPPTWRHSLRWRRPRWHTRFRAQSSSVDFSTGTGQRCPWSSCFPEPRGPLPDPGLVSCVRPEIG